MSSGFNDMPQRPAAPKSQEVVGTTPNGGAGAIMKYFSEASTSKKVAWIVGGIVIILVIVGAGVAYYYRDEIKEKAEYLGDRINEKMPKIDL